MHVLPIVTRGPTENLNSLLYLRGVDLAIINADALEEYKVRAAGNPATCQLPAQPLPSELHVFVRPEIKSLRTSRARR